MSKKSNWDVEKVTDPKIDNFQSFGCPRKFGTYKKCKGCASTHYFTIYIYIYRERGGDFVKNAKRFEKFIKIL